MATTTPRSRCFEPALRRLRGRASPRHHRLGRAALSGPLTAFCAGAALVLAASGPVAAEPAGSGPAEPAGSYPAEPAGSYPAAEETPRHGWTGGGSLGVGSLSLESVDVAGSPDGDDVGALIYELHVGGLVRPNLALLVTFWGGIHGCADCARSDELVQSNLGIAAQYWPMPRLSLVGGLGSARLGRLVDGNRLWLRAGPSLLAGVGYELLHQRSYALEVQLRLTVAGYKDSDMSSSLGALLLGLSWY